LSLFGNIAKWPNLINRDLPFNFKTDTSNRQVINNITIVGSIATCVINETAFALARKVLRQANPMKN
jgi:hypothetical protein